MQLLLRACVLIAIAVPSHGADHQSCKQLAQATYTYPGGVSSVAKYCVSAFWKQVQKVGNGYNFLDAIVQPPLKRIRVNPYGTWNATAQTPPCYGDPNTTMSFLFGEAEWVLPRSMLSNGKDRIVMIHGGSAQDSAVAWEYAGWSDHLAEITGLPVYAMNFAQQPVVPWPQNIRSVMEHLQFVLENGPKGPQAAGNIFLVGDSEGTLVTVQTVLALRDESFRMLMGFGESLSNPSQWLAGVILSAPVLDVECETPSFKWNCWNETANAGDPDTGVGCPDTFEGRVQYCRWSYLEYHFGLKADWMVLNVSDAKEQYDRRMKFFQQPVLNPLRASLRGFPPTFLVAGVRDYYYSDSPSFAYRLCKDDVKVDTFHAEGLFHDWLMYQNGCGVNGTLGPLGMIPEAKVVNARIANFVHGIIKPQIVFT